jgi:hypothetical protein
LLDVQIYGLSKGASVVFSSTLVFHSKPGRRRGQGISELKSLHEVTFTAARITFLFTCSLSMEGADSCGFFFTSGCLLPGYLAKLYIQLKV